LSISSALSRWGLEAPLILRGSLLHLSKYFHAPYAAAPPHNQHSFSFRHSFDLRPEQPQFLVNALVAASTCNALTSVSPSAASRQTKPALPQIAGITGAR